MLSSVSEKRTKSLESCDEQGSRCSGGPNVVRTLELTEQRSKTES